MRKLVVHYEQWLLKVPARYLAGIAFISLGIVIAFEDPDARTGVLTLLAKWDIPAGLYGFLLVISGGSMLYSDNPIIIYLSTLPFLFYIFFAVVFGVQSGLLNPIVVLLFTFVLLQKMLLDGWYD